MKIEGSYPLPISAESAYRRLQDPEVLARSIPGCEGLEKTGENEYCMTMKMALAALSGSFEGKVRIADQTPPTSFRLLVEGTGKIGFVNGDGLLTFQGKNGASEVTYEGDVQVGGTMAAVGQRLIDATAKMMIKRFFEKVAEDAAASGSHF